MVFNVNSLCVTETTYYMDGEIIKCSYCEKELFTLKEGDLKYRKCKELGYIYKLPLLYTRRVVDLVFCSTDCKNSWFNENVPRENIESARKSLQEFRSELPKIISDSQKFAERAFNKIEYIRAEIRRGRKVEEVLKDDKLKEI